MLSVGTVAWRCPALSFSPASPCCSGRLLVSSDLDGSAAMSDPVIIVLPQGVFGRAYSRFASAGATAECVSRVHTRTVRGDFGVAEPPVARKTRSTDRCKREEKQRTRSSVLWHGSHFVSWAPNRSIDAHYDEDSKLTLTCSHVDEPVHTLHGATHSCHVHELQ